MSASGSSVSLPLGSNASKITVYDTNPTPAAHTEGARPIENIDSDDKALSPKSPSNNVLLNKGDTAHSSLSSAAQLHGVSSSLLDTGSGSFTMTATSSFVSSTNTSNSSMAYTSVITPIKLPEFGNSNVCSNSSTPIIKEAISNSPGIMKQCNSPAVASVTATNAELSSAAPSTPYDCDISTPVFKSEFAKRLSASSSFLLDSVPGSTDNTFTTSAKRALEFNGPDSKLIFRKEHPTSVDNCIESNKENIENNGAPKSPKKFIDELTKHLEAYVPDSIENTDSLHSSSFSKIPLLNSEELLTGKSSVSLTKVDSPMENTSLSVNSSVSGTLKDVYPKSDNSDVSDILVSSCIKFSEICSNLVETSNMKLKQVLAEDADFSSANFSFNSSFDKMFESVNDEEEGDGSQFVVDTERDSNNVKGVKFKLPTAEVSKTTNVSDVECPPTSEKSDLFEQDEDVNNKDVSSSPSRMDQEGIVSNRSKSSKVCEDEMDVDFFLGDSDSTRVSKKAKDVNYESFAFTSHDADTPLKYGKAAARFECIPEDDEFSSGKSDTSSLYNSNTSGASCERIKQKASRPTTLPLFADISKKEFSLHSPMRNKTSLDKRKLESLRNNSSNHFKCKSSLKLSPYHPSAGRSLEDVNASELLSGCSSHPSSCNAGLAFLTNLQDSLSSTHKHSSPLLESSTDGSLSLPANISQTTDACSNKFMTDDSPANSGSQLRESAENNLPVLHSKKYKLVDDIELPIACSTLVKNNTCPSSSVKPSDISKDNIKNLSNKNTSNTAQQRNALAFKGETLQVNSPSTIVTQVVPTSAIVTPSVDPSPQQPQLVLQSGLNVGYGLVCSSDTAHHSASANNSDKTLTSITGDFNMTAKFSAEAASLSHKSLLSNRPLTKQQQSITSPSATQSPTVIHNNHLSPHQNKVHLLNTVSSTLRSSTLIGCGDVATSSLTNDKNSSSRLIRVSNSNCSAPSQHKLGITSICGSPIRATLNLSLSEATDPDSRAAVLSRSLPNSPHKVSCSLHYLWCYLYVDFTLCLLCLTVYCGDILFC